MTDRTCITCRHHDGTDSAMKCRAPQNISNMEGQRAMLLVNPDEPLANRWRCTYCTTHREKRGCFLRSGFCGAAGLWWEPVS